MTMTARPAHPPATKTRLSGARLPPAQHGVVLIISLILLVVISLLAVTSLRNAGSSESVAGNVRTTELATQAAEIALRHCEASVLKVKGGTAPYTTTFVEGNILPVADPPEWQKMTTWDSTSTATFVLPLPLVNQSNMALTTYQRPPECMVEPLPVKSAGSNTPVTTSFVITARGFGPEVAAADAARTRPQGTEVWLQSHMELE